MQPASTRLAWIVSGILSIALVRVIVAPRPAPRVAPAPGAPAPAAPVQAAPVQAAPARDTTTPSQPDTAFVAADDQALVDSVAQANAPAYRITIDSTFDKFRDDTPRVYVRLSRLPTSLPGLSLRLFHERCVRELMSDDRQPGHTLILEFAEWTMPELVPRARRGELVGTLEYATQGRHGTWTNLLYSAALEDKDGSTYIMLAERYVSERYLSEFILDMDISFRLSINGIPGFEFTVPESSRYAIREFLLAARQADTAC